MNVRTLVNLDQPTKVDLIHAKRMKHAFAQVFARLILLENQNVNDILNAWSITVFPGPIVGIEYPEGAKQILCESLATAKAEHESIKLEPLVKKPKPKKKK